MPLYLVPRPVVDEDEPKMAPEELGMTLGRARDIVRMWASSHPRFDMALEMVARAEGRSKGDLYRDYGSHPYSMYRDDPTDHWL